MPAFDGTGPGGRGAGTGRRLGPCFPQDRQFAQPGMGMGMGRGRGRRNRMQQNFPIDQADQMISETNDIVEIENTVSKLEQRMNDIDGKLDLLLESKIAADQKSSK